MRGWVFGLGYVSSGGDYRVPDGFRGSCASQQEEAFVAACCT